MTSDDFARLVSLACHDLRTPLATVHGFARTLDRFDPLPPRTLRYVGIMEAASAQMADLLDRLALAARIEAGRYDPALRKVDSLELARSAAAAVEHGPVEVGGQGADVRVDADAVEQTLAALATCALRFGDAKALRIEVRGPELDIEPITGEAAEVLAGEKLRDLGAAVARRLVGALGGSIGLEDDVLSVRLPT